MAQHEEGNNKCCCGPCKMHVETGTLVIATFGCVMSIGFGIWFFLPDSGAHEQKIVLALCYLIRALLYMSCIVAQQQRNHKFYYPYLIVMGISLIGEFTMFLVYGGFLIFASQTMVDAINKDRPDLHMTLGNLRFIFASLVFGLAVSTAINAYLYSVIFRAYKFLKNEPRPAGYPAV